MAAIFLISAMPPQLVMSGWTTAGPARAGQAEVVDGRLERAVALRDPPPGAGREAGRRALALGVHVGVEADPVAVGAAEQLVDGGVQRLAEDVPAGHLDRRDRGQ